jgi:hypothetical protein
VSREGFRRHLSAYHFLDEVQAQVYIGKIIPIKYKAPRGTAKTCMKTLCLFPECKTEAEFGQYTDYTDHLKSAHKFTADKYLEFMPTRDTVRLHPRLGIIDTNIPLERKFIANRPCSHPACKGRNNVRSGYRFFCRLVYSIVYPGDTRVPVNDLEIRRT